MRRPRHPALRAHAGWPRPYLRPCPPPCPLACPPPCPLACPPPCPLACPPPCPLACPRARTLRRSSCCQGSSGCKWPSGASTVSPGSLA
ncbi:hypothetical protein DLM49_20590 [Streptomyces sp. WAC 01438]|nr:hypothetical protein DLM49_20590 [Streptomyces sp. WAC 01438]